MCRTGRQVRQTGTGSSIRISSISNSAFRAAVGAAFGAAFLVALLAVSVSGALAASLDVTNQPNPAGALGQYTTSSSEVTASPDSQLPLWVTDKEKATYSPEDLTSPTKTTNAEGSASAPAAKPLAIPTPNAWSAGIVWLSVLILVYFYRRIRARV